MAALMTYGATGSTGRIAAEHATPRATGRIPHRGGM
jgi:hypothetical protein